MGTENKPIKKRKKKPICINCKGRGQVVANCFKRIVKCENLWCKKIGHTLEECTLKLGA